MSIEDIKQFAKQARLPACHASHPVALKRFADLIRADERERIKKEQQNSYVNKEIT